MRHAQEDMTRARQALLGGVLGLAVAMGVGRFAFTPILPGMMRQAGLDALQAGNLAFWNSLGYLIGALALMLLPGLARARGFYALSLAASCAATLAMGLTEQPWAWSALRLAGGIASAAAFVCISARALPLVSTCWSPRRAPLVFGGVGLGIAFTGAATPALMDLAGWQGAWIGLGLAGAVLALGSLWLMPAPLPPAPNHQPRGYAPAPAQGHKLLVAAYFLEGLGYIATATFLVAMLSGSPALAPFADASWMVVGLCAGPSAWFWQRLAEGLGWRKSLSLAYAVQAAGIAASTLAQGPAGVLLSAAAFGGTFMGITALTMSEGSRRAGTLQTRVAAILTTAFALGQMLGPPCAGLLARQEHGFTPAMTAAAMVVLLGAALTWLDKDTRL